MSETCKWCGTPINPHAEVSLTFRCGSVRRGERWWQSTQCEVNELQARIAHLEAKCQQQQCEIADLHKELERERLQ